MRILHIISIHQWTGPASYVVAIGKYLLKKGWVVTVGYRSFYKGVFKDYLMEAGIPFTEKLKFPRGFKPLLLYNDFKNLQKLIENFKPDIVHCHNSIENILASFLKEKYKFKLVRSIHNEKYLKRKIFSSFLLNSNDYLITPCEGFKQGLVANSNISENKIKVIRGFVDTNIFKPVRINSNDFLKKEFNISETSIKIGMVARFQEQRGQEDLIKAFKTLLEENINNIKLILVGRGERVDYLKKYVKENELENHICFTGYIKDELPNLLNSLDIFVLLNSGSDGSCRAVLEAMSCGLPVVTVRQGALLETVVDGVNGFLINSKDDINMLANKLKILILDKNLREKMGKNSRDIVEKNFLKDKQLEKYHKFYLKILGREK